MKKLVSCLLLVAILFSNQGIVQNAKAASENDYTLSILKMEIFQELRTIQREETYGGGYIEKEYVNTAPAGMRYVVATVNVQASGGKYNR